MAKTEQTAKKQSRTAHLKDHQWKKGESGNPKGRPPGTYTALSSLLREKLIEITDPETQKTVAMEVVEKWVNNVKGGKEKSLEMMLDRTEGKVTEHIITESTGAIVVAEAKGKTNKQIAVLARQALRQQIKSMHANKEPKKED